MLSYSFSRREKVLLAILAAILLFMLWYLLVWQHAANEKMNIDAEIAETEAQTLVAKNKVGQLALMQDAVADQKSRGAKPSSLPNYDNTTALMAELNKVLASTKDYRLAFDDLTYGSEGVVERGVTITFGCESIEAGRAVMTALENGPFACTIDAATITSTKASDNRTSNARVGVNTARNLDSPFAAGLHVVFYEKNA